MKVLIILGSNPSISPYVFFYINSFLEVGWETHLLFWKRRQIDDNLPNGVITHIFDKELNDQISPIRKIAKFLKFKRFIKRTIKCDNYNFVVVLDTQFAVLINKILIKCFSGRFFFDMRDLSYERFSFYKRIMNLLVDASSHTFISSDGFRRFFNAQSRISTLHNIQIETLNSEPKTHHFDYKINISFWGILRDLSLNIKLVEIFGRDNDFILNFFGPIDGTMRCLKKHCEEKHFSNVCFHGSYKQEERRRLVSGASFVHNLFDNYGTDNPIMSNKFYDSVSFGIPQLCAKGSYMGKIVEEQGLGLSVDVDNNLPSLLKKYISSFDSKVFLGNCSKTLAAILKEQEETISCLKRCISNIK